MRSTVIALVSLLAIIATAGPVAGAEAEPLRVAISPFSPFVVTATSKTKGPEGFSIELWEAVAQRLKVETRFVQTRDVSSKLAAVREGHAEVAIGGITMTNAREALVDFAHPTFYTGLDILVRADRSFTWNSFLSFFTADKISVIIGFLLLIVIAGHVVWLAERGKPAFADRYYPGVFEGMYWAVVTASTVGYGDKAPVRWLGRLVACLVIVIALPLFALFTAAITSSFTVRSLQGTIQGPSDLRGKRVAVIKGTAGAAHVDKYHARKVAFAGVPQAAAALIKKRVDAVVYDAPNLRYYAQQQGGGRVEVVGKEFMRQRYAFAVPHGSALRERINRALLALDESGDLRRLKQKYFGEDR